MIARRRLWLTASVLLNVALAVACWRATRSGWTAATASASSASHAAPAPASPAPPDEVVRALGDAFAATDLSGLLVLLSAAGLAEDLREALLRAVLEKRYEARFEALMPDFERQAVETWWRDLDYSAHFSSRAGLETELARERLQQEFDAELARLLGRDPRELELEDNPWQARDYGGLPRDKAAALFRIERDYQELERRLRSETMGFELASDREKLALLEQEKERDLAALLTPEERAAWEVRASPSAQRARYYASRHGSDEAEYRRIYELVREQERRRAEVERSLPESDDERWRLIGEIDAELEAGVVGVVGPDRAALAARNVDVDFANARLAVERLGLPADVPDRVYALREGVRDGLRALAAEPDLEPDAFAAATRALAESTRAAVVSALGVEGAAAYFENGGMRWLEVLDRGEPVFFTPEGAFPGPP